MGRGKDPLARPRVLTESGKSRGGGGCGTGGTETCPPLALRFQELGGGTDLQGTECSSVGTTATRSL